MRSGRETVERARELDPMWSWVFGFGQESQVELRGH